MQGELVNMIKIIVNPDVDMVKDIRKQLKDNDGYCPCRLVKNEDTKCICKEFKEQVERHEAGECHCGLYIATIQN